MADNTQESAKEEVEKKLSSLKARAKDEMLRMKTVFPFDLFPNEVVIDEEKITIHNNLFFWSGFIETIPLDEIEEVLVSTSPFTATLELHIKEKVKKIQNLQKDRAIEAKEILTGYLSAKKKKIDLEKLERRDIASVLKETGAIHGGI